MNLHKNARTTPHSRLLMVRRVLDQKQPATRVAADFGVSERTVRKWLARWRAGGEPARNDRSSAPARQRRLRPERVAAIEALRRQRLTSPVIARGLGLPLATVGSVLRRRGLGRLKSLDPSVPVVRFQRRRPGELIPIDTKKLGRIAGIGHRITGRRSGTVNRHRGIGWESLHVAVDDAARLADTARRSGPTTEVGPGSQARCPTSAKPAPSPSSSGLSPGSPVTASRSSGS
jgi:transposase-like protein